jgi:murein DD-endopeptidase MepM/ murein hydrolase activator NlpD
MMKRIYLLALAAALFALPGASPAAAQSAPSFIFPVRCEWEKNCWPVNYVDHDPGPGIRDYACGVATYNAPGKVMAHKGTDIAIRDLAAMKRGVPVLAAAAGRVVGVRDGVRDVDVSIAGYKSVKGRECGNGVVIAHNKLWRSQYCHMRQGSVTVRKGQMVAAGQVLGMVGMSGLTQFPHLHFQVFRGRQYIDPFTGPEQKTPCEAGSGSLWKKKVLAMMPYRPTAIYTAGFAGEKANPVKARAGDYNGKALSRLAPAIVLWADIFNARKGDKLTFKITAPGGREILDNAIRLGRNSARKFRFAGLRRKSGIWQAGIYKGEARLDRQGDQFSPYIVKREVVIK